MVWQQVMNELGFNISRMLAKTDVYREEHKKMQLKRTNQFNACNREAEAHFEPRRKKMPN